MATTRLNESLFARALTCPALQCEMTSTKLGKADAQKFWSWGGDDAQSTMDTLPDLDCQPCSPETASVASPYDSECESELSECESELDDSCNPSKHLQEPNELRMATIPRALKGWGEDFSESTKDTQNQGAWTKTVFGCPIETQKEYTHSPFRERRCTQTQAPVKTVLGCPIAGEGLYAKRTLHKDKMTQWTTVLGCPVGDESLYRSISAGSPSEFGENAELKNEATANKFPGMPSLSNQEVGNQAKGKENRGNATKTVFGCPVESQRLYKSKTGGKTKCGQVGTPPKTVLGSPISNGALYTRRTVHKDEIARWKTVLGCPVADESLYTSISAVIPSEAADKAELLKNEATVKESPNMPSLSNQVAGTQAKSVENRGKATKTVFGCPLEGQCLFKSRTGRKRKCGQGGTPSKTVLGCPISNGALYTRRTVRKDEITRWKTVLGCPVGDQSV